MLRIALATDPLHLDPVKAADGVSGTVLRMIGEGLTRLDDNGKPEPALAASWQISPDGCTYTFHLRKSKWSNGQWVTAEHFVQSWRRMVDPEECAANAYLLFPILHARLISFNDMSPTSLGVEALDYWTLRVTLERPLPFFLQLLAFDAFFPSLRENSKNSTLPIACGPFVLKSWKPRREMILEKNPFYWDIEHVYLPSMQLQIIPDAQTAFHLFEKGELDWIGAPLIPIPSEASEALAKEGRVEVHLAPTTYWIQCHVKDPLLQHINIRKALSLAIDRSALAAALGLQYAPATGIIPPVLESTYLSQPHPSLLFNPELARQMWDEVLHSLDPKETPEEPIVLHYLYNSGANNNTHAKVAQLLQDQWRQHLKIQVQLQGLDWGVFLNDMRRGQFEIARFGWTAQFCDPSTFLDIFESYGAYNYSEFEDSHYMEIMQRAHRTNSSIERENAFKEAHLYLLDQLPVIPLFFSSYTSMGHPKLHGIIVKPLGRIDFKSAYWEI